MIQPSESCYLTLTYEKRNVVAEAPLFACATKNKRDKKYPKIARVSLSNANKLRGFLIYGRYVVRFVSCSNVVNLLQGLQKNERYVFFKRLLQLELLVLDDLGPDRSTSYGREQVFEVINQRIVSEKPMVATINVPLEVINNTEDLQKRRICDCVIKMHADQVFR